MRHLSSDNYRKLNGDPTNRIMKEVSLAIKNSSLDMDIKEKLLPKNPIIPRIYGLPKVHKENMPLRPIVNTIGSPTYKLAKFLANKLKILVGKTQSFVKNSTHLIEDIKDIRLDEEDILLIFDVVSLFTKILIDDAIKSISEITDEDTTKLVKVCLKSTYFSFQGGIYEQIEGVAMGSPLSPVIANLYLEKFKKQAIDSYPLKPKMWRRYVDDTHVIWPHGRDSLTGFLEHLNNQSESIKFTMELEENKSIPFLDVLITKKEDGSLSHQVYRKRLIQIVTYTQTTHHHPTQKCGVINTLVTRAFRISDKEHIEQELKHLENVFKTNGYNKKKFDRAVLRIKRRPGTRNIDENREGKSIILPYIKGTTDKIAKILKKGNIKVSFSFPNTIKNLLDHAKDTIDPRKQKGVYSIPCSCGKQYIGETGRSF
jgi:hypothetical protein